MPSPKTLLEMEKWKSELGDSHDPQKPVRDFRVLTDRFSKAEKPADRETMARRMVGAWEELREAVVHSSLATEKVSMMDDLAARLRSAAASEDTAERAENVTDFGRTFERVAEAVAAIGTPLEPAARWRPEKPPLKPEEKDARLKNVQARTKGTARNLAEAVRHVLRARREEGLPLHATFSTDIRASYAAAVTNYAMGFTPTVPYAPPTTKHSAPWGVFRVRSSVPPAEAAERFSVSPPLPARSELLESKFTRIRLAPLDRGEPGRDRRNHSGESEDAER